MINPTKTTGFVKVKIENIFEEYQIYKILFYLININYLKLLKYNY